MNITHPSRIARNTAAALCAALFASLGMAQGYVGPSNDSHAATQPGYVGPSTVALTNVRTLLEHGVDNQNAKLRGRIVSHEGGKHYTFEDDTGRIRVEIKQRYFPAQQSIDAQTRVELIGELDKDSHRMEFEVEQPIRILR